MQNDMRVKQKKLGVKKNKVKALCDLWRKNKGKRRYCNFRPCNLQRM